MPVDPVGPAAHERAWDVQRPGVMEGMSRRGFLGVSAMALLSASSILAACGGSSSSDAQLSMAEAQDIDSLNPFVGVSGYTTRQQIYPYLVGFQTDYERDLASAWRPSSDQREWEFDIVTGGKWSDGRPVTAADAAFTIDTVNRFSDGPTGLLATTVAGLREVEATGNDTLVLRFEKPNPLALNNLLTLPILPEHVWGPLAKGDGAELKTLANDVPICGGPFTVVERRKGELVLCESNPDFYGDKPTISGFGLRIIKSPDAIIAAMRNGEVDLASGTQPVDVLRDDAEFQLLKGDGQDVCYYVGFNSNEDKPEHRELLDPRVREAISMALDRDRIINTVLPDLGNKMAVLPPVNGKWVDPKLAPPPFDPAGAEQILDGLGYERGSDGVRAADGHPMSYVCPAPQFDPYPAIARLVKASLAEIGVALEIKLYDESALFDVVTEPDYEVLDSDLHIWGLETKPDPDFALSIFQCGDSYQEVAYCNERYDAAVQKSRVATEEDNRIAAVRDAQRIFYEDQPYVYLAALQTAKIASKAWSIDLPPWPYLSKRWLIEANRV